MLDVGCFNWPLRILLLLLFGAAAAFPAEPEEPNSWRIVLEPVFMRRQVTFAIPGAEKTVFAPAALRAGELIFPTREQFDALGIDWTRIQQLAAVNAEAELKALTPRYQRDRRNVIEYAELSSGQPIVASAVLAPSFLKLFSETLGDTVLLVVPSRTRAYVFPRLAGRHEEYWPMIFEAYRATPYPVSVEVFEVSASGWKAAGIYEEP